MNVENLIRLLEPLLPQKTQYWLDARETADPQLRQLLDQQILLTARQVLGDYRNRILLSLPPKAKSKRTFELGTIMYEQAKWPIGISRGELLNHVAIFGRSGAGKTNMTFHLLRQLTDKKIPWIFLDWKRTARHLLPDLKQKVNVFTPGRGLSPLTFNPFSKPSGIEDHTYINQIVDVMASAYTLGDGAKHLLQKALKQCYSGGNFHPSPENLIHEIDNLGDHPRQQAWKVTLVRALESLGISLGERGDTATQEHTIQRLMKTSSIIELDGLSENAKKLLIPMFCQWLFFMKLNTAQREKLELVIVIEEAHHVLYRGEKKTTESVMNTFVRQCRELGIGIIIVDQHPHLVSAAALGNTFTSICLNLKDPSDLSRAASLCTLEDASKSYFSKLPVGQAIVKMQDRWYRPFLIRIPHVNVAKGAVTDDVLRKYIQHVASETGRNTSARAVFGPIRRIPLWDEALNGGEIAFIEDVVGFPQDGVNQRYQRLQLSGSRGQKIKERLIEKGWLESQTVSIGKTRKVLLRLSKQAEEVLGVKSTEQYRASIAHEYWKQFYTAYFQQLGWQVKVEAKRTRSGHCSGQSSGSSGVGVSGVSGVGGRVDVLVKHLGKRIGIEIETGKSDAVKNVVNGLRAGFDMIVVVATKRKAMKQIQRKLFESGLIIPSRIVVILQNELIKRKELFGNFKASLV